MSQLLRTIWIGCRPCQLAATQQRFEYAHDLRILCCCGPRALSTAFWLLAVLRSRCSLIASRFQSSLACACFRLLTLVFAHCVLIVCQLLTFPPSSPALGAIESPSSTSSSASASSASSSSEPRDIPRSPSLNALSNLRANLLAVSPPANGAAKSLGTQHTAGHHARSRSSSSANGGAAAAAARSRSGSISVPVYAGQRRLSCSGIVQVCFDCRFHFDRFIDAPMIIRANSDLVCCSLSE